jgi:hypothetical protein
MLEDVIRFCLQFAQPTPQGLGTGDGMLQLRGFGGQGVVNGTETDVFKKP